ncbi:MAG: CocE/NonD family hydrolase [Pseudomonadota bacterium]
MPITLTKLLFAFALLIATLTAPGATSAQEKFVLPHDVEQRKTDIYSEGTRLTAHIFTPKSTAEGDRLPAVIMAQGWGGTQRSIFRDAAAIAQAGYYVATFDFRGWGESDSRVILTKPMPDVDTLNFTAQIRAIREVIDPMDMGMDWLNVLHWIQAEPQVDAEKIGLWGSSLAGGLAVYAASHDVRVKAVHAQVTGLLDGRVGRAPEGLLISTLRARGQTGYPEPRAKFNGLTGYPIPARFIPYAPAVDIQRNNSVALQTVLAEKEEYGTNPEAIKLHEEHTGEKNLVIIPNITHYGIYDDGWDQAHRLALSWFDKHLKGASD